MKLHESITEQRVINTVEQNNRNCENIGLCIACGEENDCCEPDARNYECEFCGAKQVFGAEEILFML